MQGIDVRLSVETVFLLLVLFLSVLLVLRVVIVFVLLVILLSVLLVVLLIAAVIFIIVEIVHNILFSPQLKVFVGFSAVSPAYLL